MNYLLEEIVEEEIFSSEIVNDQLLFISNNSLLFFNTDLIATVPFGIIKSYKNESDLFTISNEKGLFVLDGKGEQIYHYENIFTEHLYDKKNFIYAKNEEGITVIDLKKRYPLKFIKLKKIIKLHKFLNKIYCCTENAIFLITNMKADKIFDFSDIIDFFIIKNNKILILYRKNEEYYFFFNEESKKTNAKKLFFVENNLFAYFLKNTIVYIQLETKIHQKAIINIREVKKITNLIFVNRYLGFMTADKITFMIRFLN